MTVVSPFKISTTAKRDYARAEMHENSVRVAITQLVFIAAVINSASSSSSFVSRDITTLNHAALIKKLCDLKILITCEGK